MQENFNTEDPLGILSSKDPLGILKKKDGGAQTSSGPSPSALQRLEELRKQLKENQLVPQRTELPKQVKQAKEKAEFLQSQEKKTPKVTQMMVYKTPTFKVEYSDQEELTAKVLGFQNAQQKVQFEQEDKEKQQQKAQQAADEFYNTGTGKLYYNFINPLANAGARAIGNTGATLARLANEDDLADAIVKRFTPEKRYEGTIAGTKPTKLQGGLFNDGKMDLAKLPSTIVRGLTDMAWLIAPAGMAGRAGQAAGLTERVAQGAGLVGTSFVQTREDYYQEGKAAGLKGEALDNFATGAAGLTSALEAVFPNTLALGGFKTKLAKDYAKQIANGITTKAALKAGVKEILKEAVVKEPIQEITQLAGDKVARTIVDMSTGENNFGDQFDWDKSKDEIYETLVITPIISTLAAGSGALRNYTPTNYEKAIFYDASKNADKVNQYLDNAFIQNEIAEDQYKEAKQKFANYNNAVNQVKNLGYSEDQTLQMAWELFSGKEKMPSTQSVVSDPILKDALGAEIKKDKEALSENIRLIGMGVPSVGAEIDGKEVSYVISNIGDKGTEIGQGLVDQIGEDKYRVEEVNVTDLYNTDQEFKQYVDSYKKGSISADAMLVPAVIKDGKIVDGRARLAESYLSGKNNIKVFKNISDAINQSQVQEGRTESDLGQPQGIVQGQPEVGQGAGSQGQAQITPANVGDSNIGGQGQVAPGKRLFNEPNPEAAVIETEFKKAKGINTPEPAKITKLDEERSKRIADAYDQLVDSPNDPEVQQAYQAMADETMEQFDAIDKAGVKVEIWTGKGEPYKNSGEMIADVRDNKHMYIFSTEEGFGDTPITEEQRQQNALLRDSGIKDVNGKPLLINDIFRFVHDYFGHTRLGNSFGAIGEENAWNVHARMYSPLARRAMTTETRGQNSWVNFNKNFRNPDGSMKKKGDEGYVPPAQRPFADQKMALLPEEFSNIESSYSAMPTVAEELTRELISGPVENASKSLEATGITFDLIADPAEFDRRVEQLGGQRGTEGVFLSKEGKILLNEQKLKEGVFAGRIIWHEASHPVMNIVRNTNPDLYNRVLSGLKQVDNPAVKQAIKWANENYEGQGTIDDESIVETVAMVADGTLNLDTVPTGLKQSIIDFINLVARALGFNQVLNDTDVAAFKKLAGQVADAITTGKDISQVVGKENVKEYMSNLESPELVGGGSINLQPRVTESPAINVYESKETDDLPRRSLQDVYDQYEGKAVIINSDPTRVGELTLPSGKKIFMYGGPGYLSLKENVEGNVGFATTQIYKVNLWMKYVNELFGDKPGVTLVATQAPTSILSNSYALRYVMDGISQLPKSVLRSSDFKNEFFGKDLVLLEEAFGEKAYNDFINKYKKADLSNPEVINGMIADMAYNVGDDNKPASFSARGAFVSNLIGGIEAKKKLKTVEGDTGYVSKKPTKYISGQLFNRLGINAEKVIREIGEPSLVDLYMNEGKWGMAVSGFETDPAMTIDAVQVGGVKHPLFNAKFPGKNPFILDGAYDVNQMFTPVEMVGPKGEPYTKSAAQMLSTSMYVKGKPVEEEGAFKYQATPSVGGSIQASAGKRLAPNGKPSNLTEQQYNQVRTPEFKNWFGDWENDPANASKVVDENGEPLVVYHGTTKKFDVFEKSKGYYDNWYGLGFYFTDSLDDVKTNYSENGVDLRQKIETTSKKKNIPVSIALRGAIEGNYTIPSFQNIVNPVYLDRKIGAKDAEKILNIDGDIVEKYGYEVSGLGDYIKSKIKDLKNSTFWDLENVIRDLSIPFNDNENIVGEVIRSIYETIGYDGIVMNPYTIFNKLENRDMDVDEDTMHYISFRPNQIKSATDNTGAFSTTDNRIQASVGNREIINGFYSPIEDRINTFKQPKASVQKWKEIVGVKSDEAVFSGMSDWLNTKKPDQQLSKEEVLQFMRDNRIEINEIEINDPSEDDIESFMNDEAGEGYTREEAIEYLRNEEGATKYSEYQLPGGENYKEVLITLPTDKKNFSKNVVTTLNQEETDYQNDGNKYYDAELKLKGDKRTYFTGTAIEVEQWANRLKNDWMFKDDVFKSSHFDEANIITHLRMNTRTDADGKKVLFLEEVQSDWGQMGKKEGFGKVSRKYDKSELVVKRINNKAQVEDTDGNVLIGPDVFSNAADLEDSQIMYSALRTLNADKTVYPAPYVTNTNAWVKLGLKVALKEAVRQGADRIAWTTGDQQNERYNLANVISKITAKQEGTAASDGSPMYTINSKYKTGEETSGSYRAEELPDVVGKDLADKIISDGGGTYSGLDLQVGGKGMKAFYGDAKNPGIVANVAKALVKELTGKEGQIVPSKISSPINQDVIDRYNRARQYGNVPDALAKEYEQAQGLNSEQPAIDITPELSYAVTGGMPQFSAGNRPENNTNFKLAAFVMRKKAEGATDGEIAIGISSVTGMKPEDIKTLIDNPEQYIRDMFPSMTKLQQDNLIQKAKIQNIYRGRQFGKPIDKAFTGLEVPQEYVDEYMQKTAKSDNAVKQWATDFKRKWLDPAKGLPDWVLAIKDFASGTKNIEIAKAAKTIEMLKGEAKKIGFTDWDAFSNALVVAKDVKRYIPNEDGIVPFDAYRAAAGKMFTTPDDQLPALVPDEIKALPDEIIPYVYAMRGQIDNLTRDLIGNGYVTPEQAVTLENNIGAYVNRSYRMFNEMGYKPQPEVMNAAIKFLADDYVKKLATDKVGAVADQQIYEEAIDLAKKDVDAILNKKKNPYFNASVDRRNTGILQQRQDIPEPLRKLMGEYTDPGTVFMMTVAKQAALKGSSQYLNKLRENGMGTLFFEQNDPSRPASHSVQIAAAGTESMNPLGGLFTTPEIAEAIEMAEPTYNELTQAWMKLVGAVRWGKTVGSIATQFKNFESNLGFAVLNGYLMSGQNTPAFKAAGKYVKGQYSKAEIDAITEKAIRLNLVGQSVGARELKEMLGSGDVHDIALDISLGPDGKWGKKVAKKLNVFKEANKLYRLGDDFWKVYGYMTEREQLADARFNSKYDGLTKQQQDQIDVESSERVKNTWPTYDRVIEGAKFVSKRAPIFGNFISFQAESLRVLANSIKLAKQDMADPQLRHLGVRRAVGIAAYFGLRSAITIGLAKMAGFAAAGILGAAFGDDEEERNKRAIKQALPPFMRTSDLAVIRTKEPHKFTVISLSSLDPYAIIPNSLNAYTEGREGIFGKTMDPGVAAATTELFSSFLEPEMTFSTMWSVVNNIDPKTKQEIVISSDSDAQAAAKVGGKVWDMLEPSSVALVQRFFERKDKEAEILALGGARPYDVDIHKSFGYILSQFGKDVDAINREYNSIKYREGMSQQDKNAAEMAAEDKKAFAISKLNETYRDFINIGADPKVLNELINQRSSIKMTGFDKNTKNSIKTGKINKKTLFK